MQTPTMIQYTTAPKSNRGNRLGRGADSTSTMEQYGYSSPGTNITVSPTFSNIGNPTVEGLSVGDISLSNQRDSFSESGPGSLLSEGGPGGIQTPPLPTPPRPTPPRPSSGGGGGETRDNTLARALQRTVKTDQPGDPRVSRSELKSIMQKTGQGPRGLKNAINEGNVNIGEKALNFLNKQLEKKGAKPVGPVSKRTPGKPQNTRVTPAPQVGQQVAPFNSGSNPFAPMQQMLATRMSKANPRGLPTAGVKSIAKARAEAKAAKSKK